MNEHTADEPRDHLQILSCTGLKILWLQKHVGIIEASRPETITPCPEIRDGRGTAEGVPKSATQCRALNLIPRYNLNYGICAYSCNL